MQTVFEIFDPATGTTEGYKTREGALRFIERMERAGYVRDYLPAAKEGFYVVDMRGAVNPHSYLTRDRAESEASFSNQASDTNSYHVVAHRL